MSVTITGTTDYFDKIQYQQKLQEFPLYCILVTISLYDFIYLVETPGKFIIAKLSIRKLGSSSVLIIMF